MFVSFRKLARLPGGIAEGPSVFSAERLYNAYTINGGVGLTTGLPRLYSSYKVLLLILAAETGLHTPGSFESHSDCE